MSNKTKIILSIIGISALLIPAILLIRLSPKSKEGSDIPQTSRQIDPKVIEEAVKTTPREQLIVPSPIPASASASPAFEGSPSGQ